MAYAELIDGRLVVQTQWSEKDLIKEVPGARWDTRRKVWTTPLTWAACVVLRGVFQGQLQVGPALNQWAWNERTTRVEPALTLRQLLRMPDTWQPDPENDHDGKLFSFQQVGREFLVVAGDALLGDDMGTGKTVQVAAALRHVERSAHETGESAFPALIVCPNSLKQHWANHITDWLPEATPYPLIGGAVARRRTLESAKDDPSAIVIVNIEMMRLLSRLAGYGSIKLAKCRECDPEFGDEITAGRCEVHRKQLNDIDFRTCILDEAHRVKDPKAKQTRAIWYQFHRPGVQRRWALTGTVIANHSGELWSTMHAVASEEFPVKSKFLDRYAQLSWNAFGAMTVTGLRADTRDELYQYLDPRFRRVTKELVLPQLPPRTRQVRYVEMIPKQRKAYEEMESGNVTRLSDGSLIVARSNLVARTRLLQLASSYCRVEKPDPENPATWVVELANPSPKIDELVALLEDLDVVDWNPTGERRSVTVAAEQRRLLELASETLEKSKIPHVMITGAVSEVERSKNLAAFQAGDVPILMFTYKAGGVGLDMSRADTLIRLQRSWSLVDNKQGEDRNYRIGSEQHEVVTIIDLVTKDTVEVDQVRRLIEKLERLEEINRDRARLLAAGASVAHLDEEVSILMNADLGVDDDHDAA